VLTGSLLAALLAAVIPRLRDRAYRRIYEAETTPCWCRSGLVRQFDIGYVVIGELVTFLGGLRRHGHGGRRGGGYGHRL
jgi:hypothetical protein